MAASTARTSGAQSGQLLDQGLADAALIEDDEDPSAFAEVHAGGGAGAQRWAQSRDRDPPRQGVDGREVADERRGRCGGSRGRCGCGSAAADTAGAGGDGLDAGLVADPADDVGQGGEVAQLQVLVAFDVEPVADGGEHLGLLDGVDAEVGLEVEVQVEQLGGVAGHLGHDGHDGVGDLVGRGGGRGCC